MTQSPALLINDLHCVIAKQKILRGISFQVDTAQTVGIIGPNGSGKTTLFNCISGFHSVSQGTISLFEQEIQGMSPFQRASNGIGRVFQNFGIFREMSLFDNLRVALEARYGLMTCALNSRVRQRIQEQCTQALSEIGLFDKASQLASSLSGGQMRLLEIARTVLSGAKLILLDEPTAGVSPVMKHRVGERIEQLHALGCTCLIIEHDISFISRYCSRILVLNEGEILLDGTPEQVRNDPRLEELYFGAKTPIAQDF